MKKLFVVLVLFCCSTAMFSQVLRLRANSCCYAAIEDKVHEDWSDWEDVDILISMDSDNNKLLIGNKWDDDFALSKNPRVQKDLTDSDGDKYIKFLYNAIDQEGKKCIITISIWDDYENLVHVTVYYSWIKYAYQCKSIS